MNPDLTKRLEEIRKRFKAAEEFRNPMDSDPITKSLADIPFLLDLVESIRAEVLREAAGVAENVGHIFNTKYQSSGEIGRTIAEGIRALITQPPPNYSEVAKRED